MEVFRRAARAGDWAGRLATRCWRTGADELALAMPETSEDRGLAAARRVLDAIAGAALAGEVRLRASAGVAELRGRDDADGLLRRAEGALSRARERGGLAAGA